MIQGTAKCFLIEYKMKTRFKILFTIPYLTAYFMLFNSAGKMAHHSDEEPDINIAIYKPENKTRHLADSIYTGIATAKYASD